MKKLNFILKIDDLEIINKDCEYYSDENHIRFIYENLKLTVQKKGDVVSFIRESDEDFLEICDNNSDLKCIVRLKNPKIKINLKVEKFLYKFEHNKVKIKYIIESDENHEKTIILSL